jgi:membrane protein DedA with SNARE-associated domain
MFSEIVAIVTEYIKSFVGVNLYLGSFLMAFIETIFPPIPSEIIMPLAGYLSFLSGGGVVSFIFVVLSATLGALLGAIIIYYLAMKLGRLFVARYGKYVLIREKNIAATERWFEKHGKKAVFFGRMAPGLREIISIPAGFSKMNFKEFLLYTFLGTLIWTAFLVSIGYFLGASWENINISDISAKIAIIVILAIVAYFVFRYIIKRISKAPNELAKE